mgnify:CR=1|jgi:hypothetical protein
MIINPHLNKKLMLHVRNSSAFMLMTILILEKKRIKCNPIILIPNNTYNIGSQ